MLRIEPGVLPLELLELLGLIDLKHPQLSLPPVVTLLADLPLSAYVLYRFISEFIERGLREWLSENEIKTLYIEAGCLWQNGYIESFNARLREECLNRRRFMDRDRGASSD